MPRRFFRRVSSGYLRNERPWYLHPFRAMLVHPSFFSVSRRSVAGAICIGIFIALMPLPGQTLVAVLAALMLRVNVPIAGITTWITNPITMLPFFYWEYTLGTVILDMPIGEFDIDLSWKWVTTGFVTTWKPLLMGSFISATIAASLIYVAVSVTWRLVVAYRYKRRHLGNRP
jgi:uncharacterized protein (DUF2062 family)